MNHPYQDATQWEELADYRRSVAELYARLRQQQISPALRWKEFCRERDRLFATHPQSALSTGQKAHFTGLPYFDYNPALQFILPVEPVSESVTIDIDLPDDGLVHLQSFGKIHFSIASQSVTLTLYWVQGYGGGIFLPFRDRTNQKETYGGGRYLLDTIKNVDLGREAAGLVIDFNFAYNPSCAYNPRWVCPLSPFENRLDVPVTAGELNFPDSLFTAGSE